MAIRTFLGNTGGNVAIMAALAAVPLFGVAGVAVDLAQKSSAEARLQAVVDAATLAGASLASNNPSDIKRAVKLAAVANNKDSHIDLEKNLGIEILDDGTIPVKAIAKYPTTLSSLLGVKEMPIHAMAEARRSQSGAEVALVLDVTGSMTGTKIEALRVAATDFVTETTRANANRPDSVKLSIVPYNKYVNVGIANRNASWITVPADTTQDQCSTWVTSTNQRNCRMENVTVTFDGVTQTQQQQVCDYDYVSEYKCVPVTKTWTGCVGSREHPWNVRDDQPGIRIPGLLNDVANCPNEITPLTSNATLLKNNINALPAWGDTYIPAGLIWGWRTLTDSAPFTEGLSTAEALKENVTKHVVLMTDGENVTSNSPGLPLHDGFNPSDGDDTTGELCANIKSADIVIHTIAFDVSDPDTKAMLKACASSGNYYDATDAAALASAFESIAGQIQRVALSK